jgi:hypothetical protein
VADLQARQAGGGAGAPAVQHPSALCSVGEPLAIAAATPAAKWKVHGLTEAVLQPIRTDCFDIAATIGARRLNLQSRRGSAAERRQQGCVVAPA